jgi:hypothetical protein
MAHYAILDENNIVVSVFVGRDENDLADGVDNWETYYAPSGLTCRRTSYNTQGGVHLNGGEPFRKNYAGIGYRYDETLDGFIPPQPFPSWTLNTTTCLWDAPVPQPDDGMWLWNEETMSWEPMGS